MKAEELLDISQAPQDATSQTQDAQDSKRERLSAIVAAGGSRKYLGREVQLSDLDKMPTEELDKL